MEGGYRKVSFTYCFRKMKVCLTRNIVFSKTAEYHSSPNVSGLLLMLSVFEQTELRDREESLMPILKDILKYQYAPLKEIAIVVMHRLFTDSQGKNRYWFLLLETN